MLAGRLSMATETPGYYPVSDDTQRRVQFYDCKLCRAIVIDVFEHNAWHDRLDIIESDVNEWRP